MAISYGEPTIIQNLERSIIMRIFIKQPTISIVSLLMVFSLGVPFLTEKAYGIEVKIDKLKIIDCADDDEDMEIGLRIDIQKDKNKRTIFSKTIKEVYVEEEGKIGNDSRSTFFIGEIAGPEPADVVIITVFLKSLDKDGFQWGGDHIHTKKATALKSGNNRFTERKEHSSNPKTEGVYELSYTILIP